VKEVILMALDKAERFTQEELADEWHNWSRVGKGSECVTSEIVRYPELEKQKRLTPS
jgi:hypothetical protein